LLLQPVTASAQAPSWSAEQQAVWSVVSRSWTDEVARNGRWPGQYVHPNVTSWGPEWPMPRNKESIERWSRWSDRNGQVVQYELSPAAISIAGSTAVVSYSAISMLQRQTATGPANEAPQREAVGITETLVRDGSEWRFLSSTNFTIPK
jgi:hypothetical protein